MDILLTICARGGSKGVPGKNIRLLNGKPLIGYTIEQAKRWGRASKIIVSTDASEIAEVARRFGAEVPFLRPKTLAEDHSPKMPAIRHALTQCEEIYKRRFPIVVDLDASAPLRKVEDIEGCYETLLKKGAETTFSVVPAHRSPYFNMVEEDASGQIRLCKQLPGGVYRRQDSPKVYDMNASIYFYQRDFLLNEKNLMPFTDRTAIWEMDPISAYDIDREIDFKYLEFLVKEGLVSL